MFILPSIDLRGGMVVRLRKGDYADQLNYDVDPVRTAREFAESGASYLHIVDLDGAKDGAPRQLDLITQIIKSVPSLTVQVGGGVRDEGHVDAILAAGAARVVIGTRAVNDLPWLSRLVEQPSRRGRIVLAIDAKGGMVATHGWTQDSGRLATDIAKEVSGLPLAGLLYTDVARDGMMQGPNIQQTRLLVESTRLPVIASGGVGSLEHIKQVKTTGCWGVIVGRSLYEGTVDLPAAIAIAA